MMTMSKTPMILTTIIITSITLLFVYISYIQGKLFNLTLVVLCILDAFLIVSVVILQFENTKIETWVYKKWDQLGFENQEEIRTWVQIIVIIAVVICIGLLMQSIYTRS